jgi:hypothetical protein
MECRNQTEEEAADKIDPSKAHPQQPTSFHQGPPSTFSPPSKSSFNYDSINRLIHCLGENPHDPNHSPKAPPAALGNKTSTHEHSWNISHPNYNNL